MTWRTVTITAYLLLLSAAVGCGIWARLRPGRVPTLGDAVRRGLRHRSTQLGLLFAWWWLGWHWLTNR